ncbi:laminin subunit beta-1 isoform X2 [Photinus pyralis]|uniref:laminin subunit beta-1 isoform X2 n=1 Tax=Photinus pyralis TaxID=7054 RepID=UPI0012675EFC|nr:laminin subunit beta-1 isoform X2 [Photinus pyralis]XP_031335759.1 laminin subunit beta-1 isoform X2 [Photinus pyralis]
MPSYLSIWARTQTFFFFISYLFIVTSQQYTGQRSRGYSTRVPLVLRGDQLPPPDGDFFDNSEEIHPLTHISARWHRREYVPVRLHPCDQSSCYPATGNLLIGREAQLYASSTCGLYSKQRYCIVSYLQDQKKCFWCDSRPSRIQQPSSNHSISNIVSRHYVGTPNLSWWQSENGKENVTIQLDLEAEFHFTHLIIQFKTFRPAAMFIERSYDFGKTWQVYRYFAYDCQRSYPHVWVSSENSKNLTDVFCETKYSQVSPSTDGELIYRVLPPTLHIDNPYSQEVQNLLKMTNLRINFNKLHTLGDDLLDKREDIQEKYYYAISNMIVRGSCSCYGHANRCLPIAGIDQKPDMVHGKCECTHNTKGSNCEECEDFFNDLPWRPAIGKQTNACRKCNCNNHATSCHFDAAVYEQTGRISGGVCDGCKHNTMGSNCEHCKPFYYKDPLRDIQDPEICRPCDCDPHGSLDGGICDSTTDSVNGFEAGKCHCKTNVEGRRCDNCKNGFWNFTSANPHGCQECTCNTLGTIDNQGCNIYNGECTCKRYVTGRDCNQCLPEYWGLSDKRDGCQPCRCDPGGSYDNNCDVIGGQCKCRDYMTGRRCDTPQQQYFTASLDFLLYEAELAKPSVTCQVVIREPYRDGGKNTWTGTGFIRAFENSSVEFQVDDIKTSMDYDINLRYESVMDRDWDSVTVTIIRPNPIDPNGPCASTHPSYDYKQGSLPFSSRSALFSPPACLEAGENYKIRVDFNNYVYGHGTPSASVLIDSMVLIPHIESISWFNETAPGQYRHCPIKDFYDHFEDISQECFEYYRSIGALVFKGGLSCQCDPTGSISKLCREFGGNCLCKPNVLGRRCDRCAPGTYGFGPEGCKVCDCNSIGGLDNFCNVTTGQCKCRPNTYGRECDQCRTGFWNFPNCQRCDCNGHADICDSRTGACTNCRDNTEGHTCDRCIDGYYGDPRLGVDIPCRPCPCPGVMMSGHSFADRCSLDPYTKDVICECKEGYGGTRCDECANNFFGNPSLPGGACHPCDCSGKTDLFDFGNCDPHTGKCLKCLYDTTGDRCEICRPGFYRYDDNDVCQECVCHMLGTNSSAGPCNAYNGQCLCHVNVIGKQCDQCAENHWKIASGSGCVPCNCDPIGSERLQCNLYDGQCKCKENFGGLQCNECRENYWGDPKRNECSKCLCNIYGSETLQCHRKTGACVCRPGIGGYNCDECDRGYLGTAPVCTPCGECFDNWDRILKGHRNATWLIIERAKNIKKIGATGAYTKEFDEMQQQLHEIDALLNSTKYIDIQSIEEKLIDLGKRINNTESGPIQELYNLIDNITQGITLSKIELLRLGGEKDVLQNKIKDLETDGTALQEGDVQGALTLIYTAKQKANLADQKAQKTRETINYAERQCKATENLVNVTEKEFRDMQASNERSLDDIRNNITELYQIMPELNNLVCDGRGDPCDVICGGAGCGSCGMAISCENGAKQQAENALSLANTTEFVLKDKEVKANDFIRNVSQFNTTHAKLLAQEAHDRAYEAFLSTNTSLDLMKKMKNRINEFLNQNHSTPEDIEKVAREVLEKQIDQKPEEIIELAQKIKDTVESLTNIDPIIAATADDLKKVEKLKSDADSVKIKANEILKVAEEVKEALGNSSLAQEQAGIAISGAKGNIDEVNRMLDKIGNTTEDAQQKTNEAADQIDKLGNRLTQLQVKITSNEEFAKRVIDESQGIQKEANNTHEKFEKLLNQYNSVKIELSNKLGVVEDSKSRADDLFKRAFQLMLKIKGVESSVDVLKNSPESSLKNLEHEIQALMNEMKQHNRKIEQRETYYKKCT